MVEQLEDEPVWKLVSLIYIYNPDIKFWDCVGEIPMDALMYINFNRK